MAGDFDITVDRWGPDEHAPEHATVEVRLSRTVAEVRAWGPRVRMRSLQPAEVNWPAIGAVNADDAAAFAAAISAASELAADLRPSSRDEQWIASHSEIASRSGE